MKVSLRRDPLFQVAVDVAPPGPREGRSCRRLWVAVLATLLNDLNPRAGQAAQKDRRDALAWIGTRGFRDVCALAGIDPEAAEPVIRGKLARGERFVFSADGDGQRNNTTEWAA